MRTAKGVHFKFNFKFQVTMTEKKNELAEKPEWGGWPGFRFSDELTELFNTVSKANALFIKLTETEYQRWGDYGEDPEHFCKGFSDAMEYNTKAIEALSDYAAELVKYEMYERFK